MSPQYVSYNLENHTAWLTMSRPEVLNALSKGMLRELQQRLSEASRDDEVHCIGIKGAGRAFSAGLDVKEVAGFGSRREATEFVYKLVKPFWQQYFDCEKPILSVVDGPAYGAGAEIALASDIVVASTRSTFAFSGGRVGALCCISAALGQFTMTGRKLIEMNLGGASISAQDASSFGLVSYAEDPSKLHDRVSRILDEIRHVSPISNSAFKRIRRGLVTTRTLNVAYRELLRTITSPDFEKGVSAFKEKISPEYYH